MPILSTRQEIRQVRRGPTCRRRIVGIEAVILQTAILSSSLFAQPCLLELTDTFDAQIGVAPIAVGDFDGDGNTDWAGTTRDQTVSVYLGDGTGEFLLREPVLGVGANLQSLVAIDSANGGVDLLVVRHAAAIVFYKNDGTGLFSFDRELRIGDVTDFSADDFNNDGLTDLAIARTSRMEVLIYLASDEGGFEVPPVHRIASVAGLRATTTGIFNNDAFADLAIATATANDEITVYFGTGTGTFRISSDDSYFVSRGPREIVTADMDDDGQLDLVITSSGDEHVTVLRGFPTGAFFRFPVLDVLIPRSVGGPTAIGDFNGDGILDVAVTHFSPSRLSILAGDGTGVIASGGELTDIVSSPWFVATGDFDNSGSADLIVNNSGNSSFSVLLSLEGDEDGDGVCGLDDVCPGADDTIDGDGDGTPDACDDCPLDAGKVAPGACGCGVSDADDDGDGVANCADRCPRGNDFMDSDGDGTPDGCDDCPEDQEKSEPGVCGCRVSDRDEDNDAVPDCEDRCPGGDDTQDGDADDTPDACDDCPDDSAKVEPGVCGCGVPDRDEDNDAVPDCEDRCPGGDDSLDGDADDTPDACDDCPDDSAKVEPGVCGCGVSDLDDDADGVSDCEDTCPGGDDAADVDGDGTPDACDDCPEDATKVHAGVCGCGNPDWDDDNDGVADCLDIGVGGDDGIDDDDGGIPDSCDSCPDVPNADQTDLNADGVGDEFEMQVDPSSVAGSGASRPFGCGLGIVPMLPLLFLGICGFRVMRCDWLM